MTPKLNHDLTKVVDDANGLAEVEGDGRTYVVMSLQVYRDMMGVGTEDELQESLAAVDEGLADVEAGRTVPMAQVFRELDEKYDE